MLVSCKQGQLKFKDVNEGSTHVYGNIDGPPKQADNTYPSATEKTANLANQFRQTVELGIQK